MKIFGNSQFSFFQGGSPFTILKLRNPCERVARRFKTAKGTAQGISLSGFVFPQPPDHNKWPKFRHKKTAHDIGCGFARLYRVLKLREKEYDHVG